MVLSFARFLETARLSSCTLPPVPRRRGEGSQHEVWTTAHKGPAPMKINELEPLAHDSILLLSSFLAVASQLKG